MCKSSENRIMIWSNWMNYFFLYFSNVAVGLWGFNYWKVHYKYIFQVFHNCSCVSTSFPAGTSSSVKLGQCPHAKDCSRSFTSYMAVSVLSSFISSLGATPGYMVIIRSVHHATGMKSWSLWQLWCGSASRKSRFNRDWKSFLEFRFIGKMIYTTHNMLGILWKLSGCL